MSMRWTHGISGLLVLVAASVISHTASAQFSPGGNPPAPPPPTASGLGDSVNPANGNQEALPRTFGNRGVSGKIVRGSSLIGLTMWDPRQQQLGVVKDFLIDSQTGLIEFVLIESPDLGQQWAVVPFDVLQVSVADQDRPSALILNVPIAEFRQAPRMQLNQWSVLREPQFLGRLQGFYGRLQRSAARPIPDETYQNREDRSRDAGRSEEHFREQPGMRHDHQPNQGLQPGTGGNPQQPSHEPRRNLNQTPQGGQPGGANSNGNAGERSSGHSQSGGHSGNGQSGR